MYGVPPAFDPGILLEEAPLEIATYPGAFISRREVVNEKDGVRFESLAQWYSRGAIYDNRRKLLQEFDDPTDTKFDNPAEIPIERVEAAARVPGKCIYLGTLHGHFGHFLVESLSRAWALLRAEPDLPVMFHYAHRIGGELFVDPAQMGLPRFTAVVFDALGIDAKRLVLASQDIVVDELIVPRSQLRIGKSAIGAPGLPLVYDFIRDELQRGRPSASSYAKKIYLTRTRLRASQQLNKSIVNEPELEELFRDYGFDIVAPEQLTFEEQISVISHATHIAGTTGSALHMALFNGRPDACVIGVDWRNNRTQYILEAARGIRADHIYCYGGGRAEGNRPLVNIDVVERALAEIFGRNVQAAPEVGRPRTRRPTIVQEAGVPQATKSVTVAPELSADWLIDMFSVLNRTKPEGVSINYAALTVCGLLFTLQTSLGIQGDFLEGSLNAGQQLLDLFALQSGERGVFRTMSRENQLERWEAAGIASERQQRADFFEDLAQIPSDEGVEGRFRWLHLDSGTGPGLDSEVRRLSASLKEEGLLLIGNFFDIEALAATESVFAFIASEPDWRVLIVTPGLACLVRNSWKLRYEKELKTNARKFLSKCGAFRIIDTSQLLGDSVLTVKGSPNRLLVGRNKD